MLQTDASQAASAGASAPDARNDVDALAPGSAGPETGNVITAAGTISAPAGADQGANVTVVAVQGQGGGAQMSPAAAGPMEVQGRYGTLTIDADGNYSYVRKAGTPDGVEDVFTYTIANAAGGRDSATLTILIGREGTATDQTATQVVTTNEGVVVLPAGVELSDIRVVGRDLVITLPDGSTMTIPNGAVFVPQLVIGDVEVPPSNLAALLIDAEPQPAAGTPQSSGGNFASDVPPLDPGVPLGDLLPPTDFGFTPPVFEEVGQFIDREPDVEIQPDGQPASANAVDSVDESGLPARVVNGVSEPAGTNAAANSETTTGTILVDEGGGPSVVAVNGVAVTAVGQVIAGQYGSITITSIADGAIGYSYTLADNTSGDTTHDDFTVTVTDRDGDVATGTLRIDIVDDVPTANNDAAALTEGGPTSVTFDVDLNDVTGADGFGSRAFTSLNGTYGTITLNADGTQTYTLNSAGVAAINGLAPGATLTDTFTYNLTDGDGDSDPATVTITLTGTDDPVIIRDLTPAIRGGDAMVDEDDLASGSDTSKESLTTTGTFSVEAQDGVKSLSIGGTAVITNGVFTPATITTPLGNTLQITGYNAATGVVSYSYTLLAAETHASGAGENSLFDNLTVTLVDTDNDTVSDTLSINIVDDVPTANNDSATQGAENAPVTVDVLANDVRGADGVANANVALVPGTLSGAGTLAYNGNGTFTYTPASGEEGTVSFQYQITDGDGDQSTATVTISLRPDSTPTILVAEGSDTIVDEAALPSGSNPSSNGEFASGNLVITTGNDTIGTLVIDGVDVTNGGTVNGTYGVLTVTGSPSAGYSYSYQLTTPSTDVPATAETDDFAITVTDSDGDPASTSLVISIVDDVPTAHDDAYTILEGDSDNAISFDVDLNDVPGADGTGSRVFTSLTGTYGTITLNGDGTQTYTLNATGIAAINALPPGATLTDTFSYTLTDGDGDSDPATVTITLEGTDDGVTITNLTPAVSGGEGAVDEDDLPDGSDTAKESLSLTGTFNISAPDGVDDLTVGGVTVISNGTYVGGTVTTALGNQIVFNGYNAATGELSYTYTLLDNEQHADGAGQNDLFDSASVVLTDVDGDTATDSLVVQVIDDVPAANDDAYTILEGDSDNAISFDVDLNDVPGADGTASRTFTSLTGTYGSITLNGDGTQTYTLNAAGIAALNGLAPGATLTDTFTYTLTDGDSDSDPATVTITLRGTDDPPVITDLTPAISGGEGTVDEDDLPDGSDTSKESLSVSGTFKVSAADGIDDLTVGGVTIISNGTYVGGTVTTPLGNQIVFTGFNTATGELSYTYTLLDNEAHANGGGENSLFDNVAVSLTDTDGDLATDTLSVRIVDDVPTANNDAYTILEGDSDNAISFDVDLNDVPGADGTASRTFTSLTGTYGTITVNSDGTQTYTLNATGIAAINALAPGATLTDTFTYTLTDGDSDSDPATVTITLQGTDDGVTITNLTPAISGGDAVVDEDDLPSGSDTAKESLTATGDFTISAPDGVQTLSVNGVTVISNGVFTPVTITSPLGNTLSITGYNAATGVVSYSYTLNAAETHPNANGQNNLFDNMTVVLTDTDGDSTSDTLSVRIVDDVPTANNDTATQATENSTVTINAFANDVFGADGVDTDNNPNVAVTFTQPAQGTVSYNPSTGLFTFTPAAGQQGSTSFNYTITDADGDQATATVTINLLADSTPQVVNVTAAVDDDALAGGNPGGTGDLDANLGEPGATPSEAVYSGQINVNFGGDTGTVSFANLNNTTGTVGTETILYTWNSATNTLTATVNAGARAGTALFTVNVTPSGAYTVTLLDNVLHAAGGAENDAIVALNYQAADSDGDVSTAGTLTITFDDDTPVAFDPAPITSGLQNAAGESETAALDVDTNINNNVGADQPGLVTFANITNGMDSGLTSGGQEIDYFLTNNGQTLEARVGGASGTLIFNVALHQSAGTYTVNMFGTIDNGAGFVFDDLTSTSAGNVLYRGVGANDPTTMVDLLLSASAGGAAATVNTDSDSIGSANQSLDAGETVRIDFVTNLTSGASTTTGFGYTGHVSSNQFLGEIPQVQGNQAQTVSFTVFALDSTLTQGGVPDRTPDNGISDSTITEITSVTVQDYQTGGTATRDISGVADGATVNVAYGISVTKNADGSVTFQGIQEGDHYGFTTAGGTFNAVLVDADGSFDLGIFSIGVADSGDPIHLSYDLALTDADGDTVTVPAALDITIQPDSSTSSAAAPTTTLAANDPAGATLLASDGGNTDHQLKTMNAANSNTVLLGAIAAAGLVATPVAAHETSSDLSQVSTTDFTSVQSDLGLAAMTLSEDQASRSLLSGETRVAAEDANTVGSTAGQGGEVAAAANTLVDAQAQDHAAPTELLQAVDTPAMQHAADVAPVAEAVAMPSAEALASALDAKGSNAEQATQHDGEVGRVLADALAGGRGPDLHALIEAATDGNHANRAAPEVLATHGDAAAEAVASQAGAAVPGWDSAAFAGFTQPHAFSMEALMAHPDAAPAAHAS